MLRPARTADLLAIGAFLPRVVKEMAASGSDQWDERYPTLDDFARDVAQGTLFVEAEGEAVRGVLCLNLEEPAEYAPLVWSQPPPALVLHRLAVDPAARGRGVAHAMFDFAELHAARLGLRYLRSDTYSRNPPMHALFTAHGWRFVGLLRFLGRLDEFRAWDKVLPGTPSK
jgi:GNAT superfamily N-acetyltransferase